MTTRQAAKRKARAKAATPLQRWEISNVLGPKCASPAETTIAASRSRQPTGSTPARQENIRYRIFRAISKVSERKNTQPITTNRKVPTARSHFGHGSIYL